MTSSSPAEADLLATPRPSRRESLSGSIVEHPSDTSADPSPLSFKRRAPGRQNGLFSGLLSSSKPVDALQEPRQRSTSNASALRRWSNAIYGSKSSPINSPASRRRNGKDSGSPTKREPPDEPELPSVLPTLNPPAYSTPLPTIPMIVLCISMIGEFLSASTPAAFMCVV